VQKIDWLEFVLNMRGAMYQCGQIATRLKSSVARRDKISDLPGVAQRSTTAVSDVDYLCQEIPFLRLFELTPWIEVYSEEWASCPAKIQALFARNQSRYVAAFDPLDGSDTYLNGNNDYGHMWGVLDSETGKMQCGMIYLPESHALYFAARGQGAFVSHGIFGEIQKIQPVGQVPRTFFNRKRMTPIDCERLERAGFALVPRHNSCATETVQVAEGKVGAVMMRGYHGHDTAPASAIIEELGGVVLGIDGKPIVYEKTMARMPLVIMSLVPEYAESVHRTVIVSE